MVFTHYALIVCLCALIGLLGFCAHLADQNRILRDRLDLLRRLHR